MKVWKIGLTAGFLLWNGVSSAQVVDSYKVGREPVQIVAAGEVVYGIVPSVLAVSCAYSRGELEAGRGVTVGYYKQVPIPFGGVEVWCQARHMTTVRVIR